MLLRCLGLIALSFAVFATPAAAAKRALFDNFHAQTAGNADWIIDTDQPLPLPGQATVTATTPTNYWLGAISTTGSAWSSSAIPWRPTPVP